MNANDVIEAYVTDVVLRLPRAQRNDVAFELRALLDEELQAKAEAGGREADAAVATAMLQAFGRPADVAARYRPTLTIIDPADGRAFLRATVIGLAIIWCLGLLENLRPVDSGWDLLGVIGQWWWGAVVPSLWWPGVLVAGFGIGSWVRHRWPRTSQWKPRAGDRIHGGRAAKVLGLVGIACGLFVLFDPHWLLDVVWQGRAAPAAYQALTYTDAFLHRQAPWLFGLIVLNIPIFVVVIAKGRWSATMRRIEDGLSLATCAAMAWTVMGGPVFMAPASDRMVKFLLVLITAVTLVTMGLQLYRRVRPAPGGFGGGGNGRVEARH
jgi:hypothetical protein